MIPHDRGGPADSSFPHSAPGSSDPPPAPRPTLSMAGVTVVIAAFNEESTVGAAVRGVRERVTDVVVVDDGSADRTALEAGAAGAIVLRHLINRGQGAALKTGIVYALERGARVIVTFDSDGQHRPEDLEALVSPLRNGEVDVVLGSRFLDPGTRVPPVRWITLKLGILFTRIVSRIRVTDAHNGLRAFTREAAQRMNLHEDRMAHASEILDEISRLRLRYREVPARIVYTDYSRQKGQHSTAALRIALDFLLGKLGKGY